MRMRSVAKIFRTQPTIEGAGVHLMRGFAGPELGKLFDPFLLFDDFSNTDADAYEAGFPLHPHRGIETVTYMLSGEVHHKDSMGNEGSIKADEIQWMTAGSGILHEEMPVVHEEGIKGFQLWVNLPQSHKMMSPRYQEIKSNAIPVVEKEKLLVRVIAGEYEDVRGPVQDLLVSPTYLDVALEAGAAFSLPTNLEDAFFVYVFLGSVVQKIGNNESWIGTGDIALLTTGDSFSCEAGKEGARFLIVGGTPLHEPIAWHGPIVMNSEEEIQVARRELQQGIFIK